MHEGPVENSDDESKDRHHILRRGLCTFCTFHIVHIHIHMQKFQLLTFVLHKNFHQKLTILPLKCQILQFILKFHHFHRGFEFHLKSPGELIEERDCSAIRLWTPGMRGEEDSIDVSLFVNRDTGNE